MRVWCVLLLFFIPLVSFSQGSSSLKKKYFGKYKGTIPAYKIQSDTSIMDVAKDLIDMKIGNMQMNGTYRVLFKAKKYYLIEARLDGESYAERIKIYVRGKTLEREGLYPQPDTELEKI